VIIAVQFGSFMILPSLLKSMGPWRRPDAIDQPCLHGGSNWCYLILQHYSTGLEWAGGEHMIFWPEPAHAGLIGLAVHMVADYPVYPISTKSLCRHRVCLVKIDLDKVVGGPKNGSSKLACRAARL
jgi:hypothetical protein